MKPVLIALALSCAISNMTVAQDFPKPTEAGVKAFEQILELGQKAEFLKATKRTGQDEPTLESIDVAKFKALCGEHRDLLTTSEN